MAAHTKLGRQGEDIAAEFLEQRGFKILERNWRIKHKEIHIIAKKKRILHVVEVKTRTEGYLIEPELCVSRRKQKLLISAANAYVVRKRLNSDVIFDIIAVIHDGVQFQINHIEDAFSIIS